MRALIVTNMYPTAERPALGSFVRDQVEALRRITDVDVEVFSFDPGSAGAYARAAAELRHRRDDRFDIVHSHFGLTAWPALAARGKKRLVTLHGTDLVHPRSRAITLAALRLYDRVAVVSPALAGEVPSLGPVKASHWCCRAASTRTASGRYRARRRGVRWGSTPRAVHPVPG